MDERIRLIAEKDGALCHIEIARLIAELLKLQDIPEPQKENIFQSTEEEMKKALQDEVKSICEVSANRQTRLYQVCTAMRDY